MDDGIYQNVVQARPRGIVDEHASTDSTHVIVCPILLGDTSTILSWVLSSKKPIFNHRWKIGRVLHCQGRALGPG